MGMSRSRRERLTQIARLTGPIHPDPDAGLGRQAPEETPEETPEKRHYRLVARRIRDDHPGALTVTTYAYAVNVVDAVMMTLEEHEKPMGLYGVGLYRIEKVEEYPYGQEPDGPQADDNTYQRGAD